MATASRVLNGSARVVNAALSSRVADAARDPRYVPNAHAEALVRERGIELAPERVAAADFSRDAGMAATLQLLDRCPDLTAIFALNDLMAIGTLAALRQRGVAVPQQVSLIGYDDIPSASDVTPALTSVRVPMAELGERAVQLALAAHDAPAQVEHLPVELVLRASTAPPPAAA